MNRSIHLIYSLLFIAVLLFVNPAEAKIQCINLVVAYKPVNFTGTPTWAIAVNNQIPAPILHLKEGQPVIINVYNQLNKGTTVHWHGLIVPWQIDGVSGVSQKPIRLGMFFITVLHRINRVLIGIMHTMVSKNSKACMVELLLIPLHLFSLPL